MIQQLNPSEIEAMCKSLWRDLQRYGNANSAAYEATRQWAQKNPKDVSAYKLAINYTSQLKSK